MSDSDREQDLAYKAPDVHPKSAIELEAIRNSNNPLADVHQIGGEVSHKTIERRLKGSE